MRSRDKVRILSGSSAYKVQRNESRVSRTDAVSRSVCLGKGQKPSVRGKAFGGDVRLVFTRWPITPSQLTAGI
ncbi:hypothetical protein HZH66_003617 [Vespula vulgaris]|nr:hypothetical protein HZH66_003617 [Vespula vulgaris]